MGISVRQQGIFVAVEDTYNTAETLVGADALQVMNLQMKPAENLRMIEREIIRASLNPEQAVYGGSLIGFTFDAELKGSGTAGTAPLFGRLMQACGFSETVVASTSVTYAPESDLTAHKGVTIGYREGGNYRIAKGCRGNVSINLTTGQYGKLSFTMLGHISSETAATAPTPTFESTVPPAFVGATFKIGTFAAPIEALTVDMSNTIAPALNPNNSDGFGDIRITARNTQGTVNPEVELIGTKDYIALFRAGTQQAIQTGTIGGTAGNQWALSLPKAYFRNVEPGDRDSLLVYSISFGAAESSSLDDEISLVLT